MTQKILYAVLVGVNIKSSQWSAKDSLAELNALASSAMIKTKATLIQERHSCHSKHYIGTGKLIELKDLITTHQAQVIICDDELTPNQTTFLENYFKLKVLDRTSLILDIFASRAQTFEAQLQVEYAQLNYLMPRLTRLWTHLSRQSGGIGSRGPGETQLETDKREIRKRMTHIKSKLKKVQDQRQLRRQKRMKSATITAALIGYTNAGKSTLMNQLTDAGVVAENKLFATLDPTSRRFQLPNKQEIVLTDTVGFIQKLPHHLINAFYSTLEEVTYADILIHVIDSSHHNIHNVLETSQVIISDLKLNDTPMLYVFNKWDLVSKPNQIKSAFPLHTPAVHLSASDPQTFASLFNQLTQIIDTFHHTYEWLIPYSKTRLINLIRQYGRLISESHEEKGTQVKATLNSVHAEQIMNDLWGD